MGFVPQLPFVQDSKEKIEEEALIRSPPPQQQQIDLSGGDKTAQFGYWEHAQDFTEEMDYIRAMLEGKQRVVDDKGYSRWEYPKDDMGRIIRKPFCNSEGRTWVVNNVGPVLQKGTTLSNYTIDTALDRCDITADVLNEVFYIKMDDWEIDPDKMPQIVDTIMDRVEAARRRAVNNEERGIVAKAISVITNLTGSGVPKPKPLISLEPQSRL